MSKPYYMTNPSDLLERVSQAIPEIRWSIEYPNGWVVAEHNGFILMNPAFALSLGAVNLFDSLSKSNPITGYALPSHPSNEEFRNAFSFFLTLINQNIQAQQNGLDIIDRTISIKQQRLL